MILSWKCNAIVTSEGSQIQLYLRFYEPMVDQKGATKGDKWQQLAIDSQWRLGYDFVLSAAAEGCGVKCGRRIRNAKVVGSSPALDNSLNTPVNVTKLAGLILTIWIIF